MLRILNYAHGPPWEPDINNYVLYPRNSAHFPSFPLSIKVKNGPLYPNKEVRKKRHKMLINSGVVVQHPDGSCEAVTPEEAKKRLAAMPKEQRALYEVV